MMTERPPDNDKPTELSTVKARGAVAHGHVIWVLVIGTLLAIIAMSLFWFKFL